MRPFEFLLNSKSARIMVELPADEQQAALRAFDILADHPFTTGLPHWTDGDGRENYLRFIHSWAITFYVDHAERKVRVVDFSPS